MLHKFILILLLIPLAFSVLRVVDDNSPTFCRSDGTTTHATISSALSSATANDVIFVCDGSYSETTISPSAVINLTGQSQAGVFITFTGGATMISFGGTNSDSNYTNFTMRRSGTSVTFIGLSSGQANPVARTTFTNITLDNVTINTAATSPLRALLLENADNNTFRNITIGELRVTDSTSPAPQAIFLRDSSNNSFIQLNISGIHVVATSATVLIGAITLYGTGSDRTFSSNNSFANITISHINNTANTGGTRTAYGIAVNGRASNNSFRNISMGNVTGLKGEAFGILLNGTSDRLTTGQRNQFINISMNNVSGETNAGHLWLNFTENATLTDINAENLTDTGSGGGTPLIVSIYMQSAYGINLTNYTARVLELTGAGAANITGIYLINSNSTNVTNATFNNLTKGSGGGSVFGMRLVSSYNNTLATFTLGNLTGTALTQGIRVEGSTDNVFRFITTNNITSSSSVSDANAVYLSGSNANITNLTTGNIRSGSGASNAFGFELVSSSSNSNFTNISLGSITQAGSGSNYGISLTSSSSNNFTNVSLDNSTTNGLLLTSSSTSNTFLNVTHNPNTNSIASGSNATIRWYININAVNASTNASISGANISVNDTNSVTVFTGTTSSPIVTALTNYIQSGSTQTNYTPHSLNASASGYDSNSTNVTLNTNQVVTIMLTTTAAPAPAARPQIGDSPRYISLLTTYTCAGQPIDAYATISGSPAQGIEVRIVRNEFGTWQLVSQATTGENGRASLTTSQEGSHRIEAYGGGAAPAEESFYLASCASPTPTPTHSPTPRLSPSPSPLASPSPRTSPNATITPTPSPTATPTTSPLVSPSPSGYGSRYPPSITPSPSLTLIRSPTPQPTPSPSPSPDYTLWLVGGAVVVIIIGGIIIIGGAGGIWALLRSLQRK